MKILFLTNNSVSNSIIDYLKSINEDVVLCDEKISNALVQQFKPDYAISYNYNYIIKDDTIKMLNSKIINLHCSYLPFNKGTYPNFWSFIENTPKGITIHQLVKNVDEGDIYAQKEMFFDENTETFSTSYFKLCNEMFGLFVKSWNGIKNGEINAISQIEKGTFHLDADILALNNGKLPAWNMNIAEYKIKLGGGVDSSKGTQEYVLLYCAFALCFSSLNWSSEWKS